MFDAVVVVSCFNQRQYISECLDSILSQVTNFKFIILISDDCSTDGTQSILKYYKEKFPEKVELTLRDKNLGLEKNYVAAHQQALADIVFHIDGDDVMLPLKLQKQYDLFQSDESINLIFHRALYFSDDGIYQVSTGFPLNKPEKLFYFTASDLALWGTIAVHSSYAYRKSSRSKIWYQRNFVEWYFAMDSLLPKGVGVYINEILVKYRCNKHPQSYSSTIKGRTQTYTYYFDDIFYYFRHKLVCRSALYSNCLITALAMIQSKCKLPFKVKLFLITNCFYFKPLCFIKTYKMRISVRPEYKIR